MQLQQIDKTILTAAVHAQPNDEFDSHDLIFWITRHHPREYAADLHADEKATLRSPPA